MSYDNTPNRLESAFIQRDNANQYYEQVNLSGSDLVIYHDENGLLTADKVLVWATKYGIGAGGQALSSSWASHSYVAEYASQSISTSVSLTASYLIGGSDLSVSASWASASIQSQFTTESLYSTQSLYSTSSISASYAETASNAQTASYLLNYAPTVSSSWASSSMEAWFATQSLYATRSITASNADTASYVSASNIGGTVLSASFCTTASYALMSRASASLTASSADTASTVQNGNVLVDMSGNASFTNYVTVGGSLGAGKLVVSHPFGDITLLSGSINVANNVTASNYMGHLAGLADTSVSASWASSSISASYARSASWASASISASYAYTASSVTASGIVGTINQVRSASFATVSNTASYVANTVSSSFASASISASYANSASYAIQASNAATAVSASYAPVSGDITNAQTASMAQSINFIPSASLSASWASSSVSASYAYSASIAAAISFIPTASLSASWVSASAFITTAQTASFVTASNIKGIVATSSIAILAYTASSLNFVPNTTYFTTQSLYSTQSLFSTQSLNSTQSLYSTQSLNATQSLYSTSSISASIAATASYVTSSNIVGTVATAVSASWASASVSASYSQNATSASYADTVITASYVSASNIDGFIASSSYAISASHANQSDNSQFCVSASYAPVSGVVTNAETASLALTASLVTTASYAFIAQNSLTADFANLAGAALSADFAVLAGNTLYTASFANTASWAYNINTASYAITASFALNGGGGGVGGTASFASASMTASYLTNTGYVPSISTSYYMMGAKQFVLTNTASSALTVTLATSSNVYVKFTYHGWDTLRGSCFFMGEYFLQKENDIPITNRQPGEIIQQYNSNQFINVQSFIPDIAYDTGSAAIAIQLKGTGSFTGSLVYEIRGPFTAIDQPYVPVVTASAFGENFESYPLGLINVLSYDSPAFSAPGAINAPGQGIVAIENFDAYPSGTVPALNAGLGWAGTGLLN